VAPPTENNTEAYISNVSAITGIAPDDNLGDPQQQPANWLLLAAAMAIQENGPNCRDPIPLLSAWRMI
jgi:hypothetical protein